MPTSRCAARAALLAALFVAAPVGAGLLEGEPFLRYRLTQDDNLFREPPSGPATDSRIQSLTLGAAARYTVGLQRFTAGLELERLRFAAAPQLDHTAGRAALGWDWQWGRIWAGELALDHGRELEGFADREGQDRRLLDRTRWVSEARWQPTTAWALIPRLEAERLRSDTEASRDLDRDEAALRLGWEHTGSPVLGGGARIEARAGRFPSRERSEFSVAGTGFSQADLRGVIRYAPTALSRFDGSLGFGRREIRGLSAAVGARDVSGLTGDLRYEHRLTPRSLWRAEIFRDLRSVEEVDASAVAVTGAALAFEGAVVQTLRLEGRLRQEWQDFTGSPAFDLAGSTREDRLLSAEGRLRWQPRRGLALTPFWRFEQRRSNQPERAFRAQPLGVELELRLD